MPRTIDWVAVWTAAGVIIGLICTIATGLGWWMFRIDRATQSIKSIVEVLADLQRKVWDHEGRLSRTEATVNGAGCRNKRG